MKIVIFVEIDKLEKMHSFQSRGFKIIVIYVNDDIFLKIAEIVYNVTQNLQDFSNSQSKFKFKNSNPSVYVTLL